MTEINNITKLEIKINKLERLTNLLNKQAEGASISARTVGIVADEATEALNIIKDKFVEMDIEKTETRKRIDALLELIEKMAEQRLNKKIHSN